MNGVELFLTAVGICGALGFTIPLIIRLSWHGYYAESREHFIKMCDYQNALKDDFLKKIKETTDGAKS